MRRYISIILLEILHLNIGHPFLHINNSTESEDAFYFSLESFSLYPTVGILPFLLPRGGEVVELWLLPLFSCLTNTKTVYSDFFFLIFFCSFPSVALRSVDILPISLLQPTCTLPVDSPTVDLLEG